jgi:hypothetical protein
MMKTFEPDILEEFWCERNRVVRNPETLEIAKIADVQAALEVWLSGHGITLPARFAGTRTPRWDRDHPFEMDTTFHRFEERETTPGHKCLVLAISSPLCTEGKEENVFVALECDHDGA